MAGTRPAQLSVVVPVYNERENLPVLAAEIQAALASVSLPYEVIFVDDGSNDGSAEELSRLAAADPALRIIRQSRNSGQSAALDAGFRHARGRIVVTLDADLQNDPSDIPALLDKLRDFDVVCGVRALRRDSWLRRISSRIANGVRNRVTHDTVTDVGCSLRAMRSEFLRDLPAFNGMHRFLPTLLGMNGARVAEIPVRHRPRLHGEPKYNIRNRVWRATADLLGVRWLQVRRIDRSISREIDASVPHAAAANLPAAGGSTAVLHR